jgi:hypothetical protein
MRDIFFLGTAILVLLRGPREESLLLHVFPRIDPSGDAHMRLLHHLPPLDEERTV